MVLLITALLCEARPFIRKYSLERLLGKGDAAFYASSEEDASGRPLIGLLICGQACRGEFFIGHERPDEKDGHPGALHEKKKLDFPALLKKIGLEAKDLLINCGTAAVLSDHALNHEVAWEGSGESASRDLRGDIYRLAVIEREGAKRSYYPDLIYKTSFPLASLRTVDNLFRREDKRRDLFLSDSASAKKEKTGNLPVLLDMEAGRIFEEASKYLPLQNMFFLKVVSDYGLISAKQKGEKNFLAVSFIEKIIAGHVDTIDKEIISPYLQQLISEKTAGAASAGRASSNKLVEALIENLKLTVYMQNELRKLLALYSVRRAGEVPEELLKKFGNAAVKSKKEGKILYEQLRSELTRF